MKDIQTKRTTRDTTIKKKVQVLLCFMAVVHAKCKKKTGKEAERKRVGF